MTTAELAHIVNIASLAGITKVRLTGGEPALRHDIVNITKTTASTPGIAKVVMTTNGLALARLARPLAEAGLRGVNVSCDSLDAELFRNITKGGELARVLDGLRAAREAGLYVKINCVVMRGRNDHEIESMTEFACARGMDIRFIEYMPAARGDGSGIESSIHGLPGDIVRAIVAQRYELIPADALPGDGPAQTYQIAGTRTTVGFISAMSNPFCESCNRVRVTSAGKIRSCLLTGGEADLLGSIRAGASDAALLQMFQNAIDARPPVYQLYQSAPIDMRAIGG